MAMASMNAAWVAPQIKACRRSSHCHHHSLEAVHIRRAAELADKSAGFSSPHPNFGCVIARGENVVGEGFLYAQGTRPAELQAVEAAGDLCKGAAAFLNLEPGDCHGDHTAVSSLIKEFQGWLWGSDILCNISGGMQYVH